jgi:hypothetical protein
LLDDWTRLQDVPVQSFGVSAKASHRSGGLSYLELAYRIYSAMIRKLKSGQFRLYSRKKAPSTGKRRNLGTFSTLEAAKQHEREVQYFKRH